MRLVVLTCIVVCVSVRAFSDSVILRTGFVPLACAVLDVSVL